MLLFVAAAASSALSKHEHEAIAATRDAMCRGVVREMHTEIHKHSLKKNGEDDIFETVPAICLAIVQNYTLTKTPAPSSSWTLLKRAKKLDDEEDGMPDPKSFEHIMTLKKACEAFTDDFQLELSELMYKDTYRKDPDTIIDEFCSMPAIQKKPKKPTAPKKRPPTPPSAPKRRTEPRELPPPPPGQMPGMDELLAKYDTDGSISNLIEMERENPEAMLEPEDLAKVRCNLERSRLVSNHLIQLRTVSARAPLQLEPEALAEVDASRCLRHPAAHSHSHSHSHSAHAAPRPQPLALQVQAGSEQIRCDVCRALSKVLPSQPPPRPLATLGAALMPRWEGFGPRHARARARARPPRSLVP